MSDPVAMMQCRNARVVDCGAFHFQRAIVGEARATVQDLHPAPLQQAVHPLGKRVHDAVAPPAERVEIHGHVAEGESHLPGGPGGFRQLHNVDEGFGRDASFNQAHTAEPIPLFDEDDVLAEIGGADGRYIAPWPAADDRDLCLLARVAHDHVTNLQSEVCRIGGAYWLVDRRPHRGHP